MLPNGNSGRDPLTAPHIGHRQFVIDTEAHRITPNWQTIAIGYGYVLSYCPARRLRKQVSATDSRVLIGYAFQADSAQPPVEETLAAGGIDPGVTDASHGWSGRWVLISRGLVNGDFSNSLGLFYLHENGRLIVSSSLAILNQVAPGRRRTQRRFNRYGMNWNPPPATQLEGVLKLLPDQCLDLEAGAMRVRNKDRSDEPNRLEPALAGSRLLLGLQNVWRQLTTEFGHVTLALTAGLDSRTLMAAGLSAGAEFSAVTLHHDSISRADRMLPAQICIPRNVAYRYVTPAKKSRARTRRYDLHTFADIDEADRDFWSRGMFDWVHEGECLVRGAAFELGRDHYEHLFSGLTWEMVRREPRLLVRRFGDVGSYRLQASQIAAWIEWRGQQPGPYPWTDMFYLDQRLCGWAAAGEQGLDLLPGTSINPANCAYIQELLRSVDPSGRRAGTVQIECIRQSDTGLDAFPFNPDLDAGGTHRRAAARGRINRAAVGLWNWLKFDP